MQILLYSFVLLGDALQTFVLPERTIPPCRQPAFEEEEEEEEEPVTSGHQVAQVIVVYRYRQVQEEHQQVRSEDQGVKIENRNKE